MYSAQKLNKQDDNIQPWRTPFPIWNQSILAYSKYTNNLVNILISYIHLLTSSAVQLNISVLSCLENILQSRIDDVNVHGDDGDDEDGDGVMIMVGVVVMVVVAEWSGSNSP